MLTSFLKMLCVKTDDSNMFSFHFLICNFASVCHIFLLHASKHDSRFTNVYKKQQSSALLVVVNLLKTLSQNILPYFITKTN